MSLSWDGEGDPPGWWRPPTPFEPGNVAALQHGAYSPRRVDPLADGLVAGVIGQALEPGSSVAYLADVTYRPALWAWARCEAKVQLISEWLMDRGSEVSEDGAVLGAAEYLRRLEAQGLKHRERLGLDPLARAKLGKDLAVGRLDVARAFAVMADELDDEQDDQGAVLDVDGDDLEEDDELEGGVG